MCALEWHTTKALWSRSDPILPGTFIAFPLVHPSSPRESSQSNDPIDFLHCTTMIRSISWENKSSSVCVFESSPAKNDHCDGEAFQGDLSLSKGGEALPSECSSPAGKKEVEGDFQCEIPLNNVGKFAAVKANTVDGVWIHIQAAHGQSMCRDSAGVKNKLTNEVFEPESAFITPGECEFFSRTHDTDDEEIEKALGRADEELGHQHSSRSDALEGLESELLLQHTHLTLAHEGNGLTMEECGCWWRCRVGRTASRSLLTRRPARSSAPNRAKM